MKDFFGFASVRSGLALMLLQSRLALFFSKEQEIQKSCVFTSGNACIELVETQTLDAGKIPRLACMLALSETLLHVLFPDNDFFCNIIEMIKKTSKMAGLGWGRRGVSTS